MRPIIRLLQDDITKLQVDVIVNAANRSLLGGGGVDGAIHRAAGPGLLEECKNLNSCETGEAKITNAYELPSRFVIHTVGPVWHGGLNNEKELLASCYYNCLKIALEKNCTSIAFPNISTGVYRFPKVLAAEIAIQEVKNFIQEDSEIEKIYFVCFDDENQSIYLNLLAKSSLI